MYSSKPFRTGLTPIAAAFLTFSADISVAEDKEREMPRIDVIGATENLPRNAGAGMVLDNKEQEESHVFSDNEAMRKVLGVDARDEEGFGLRPYFGMRLLNPTRAT